MKSSTWFNRMEGFHSLEACAVHSAFFCRWNSTLPSGGGGTQFMKNTYSGLPTRFAWLLIESSDWIPSSFTWVTPAGAHWWCNSGQAEKFSRMFLLWSSLRLLQSRCFFVSLLLARTCIACCLGNSFGLTRLILRSSSPWTHQNQQFPNRQHRFRWSCHPNRHSLAYRPERPRSLSACWW